MYRIDISERYAAWRRCRKPAHATRVLTLWLRAVTERRDNFLGQQRRNRVAKLCLNRGPAAGEVVVVGVGEQPLDLADTKAAVVPVEWPDIRSGPGLDGRGGLVRRELQQE